MKKFCLRCYDARWVCEAHPDMPWVNSPRGRKCGAPGDPCPSCNRAEPGSLPALPAGPNPHHVALVFDLEPGEDLRDAVARFIHLTWGGH
jgi:hypothetical protein